MSNGPIKARVLTPNRPPTQVPGRVIVRGPQGPSPRVSAYAEEEVTPINGVLSLNAAVASTFYIVMDQDITKVEFLNLPEEGKTQHLSLNFIQDATGDRKILSTAWPNGTEAPNGLAPVLSVTPNTRDKIVVTLTSTGIDIAMAARNYLPITQ